jgi:hypothetical protein
VQRKNEGNQAGYRVAANRRTTLILSNVPPAEATSFRAFFFRSIRRVGRAEGSAFLTRSRSSFNSLSWGMRLAAVSVTVARRVWVTTMKRAHLTLTKHATKCGLPYPGFAIR